MLHFVDYSAFFYDTASNDYKNKAKNALLREFRKALGVDGEYFCSHCFIFIVSLLCYVICD